MPAFRLQRVLDLRKRREEELQQRLALAAAARVRAETTLSRLLLDEQRRREELAALLSRGAIEPGLLRELGLLLEVRGASIVAQREAIKRASAFEAEERTRLIAATVDRRALDKLHERHDEREREEANHKEGLLLDEIAARGAIAAQLAMSGGK